MGVVKKLNNVTKMQGRNVYDIMQKVEIGPMPNVSGLIGSDGKELKSGDDNYWGFRAMNLRCISEQEAQGICRDMVKEGTQGEFVIMKIYVVMTVEEWKAIESKYNLPKS